MDTAEARLLALLLAAFRLIETMLPEDAPEDAPGHVCECTAEPDEADEPVARVNLYRAKDGMGWTATWYIDVPTRDGATAKAGMLAPELTVYGVLDRAIRHVVGNL